MYITHNKEIYQFIDGKYSQNRKYRTATKYNDFTQFYKYKYIHFDIKKMFSTDNIQ